MTAEPAPVQLAPEVELLVLATLQKRIEARDTIVRATVGQRYADGDKHTFRSPIDDAKLGIVHRTDPNPQWRITDRDALIADLARYPRNIEVVDEIVGTDEQVLEVLAAHAPHLLARVERVSPEAIDHALAVSKSRGQAAYAGITKVKPAGTLTVLPDKATAAAAIERMHAAGLITWDGRPALPSGDEGAA